MTRPLLDGVELPQAQRIASEDEEVLAQHGVPALEGDFLQDLGRRAVRVTLAGVLSGAEAGEDLKGLREKFHAAAPVPFVSDIATATKVDKVLIEEMGVRELAGRTERFEYALSLREYTPPPAVTEETPPVIPVPPVPVTATLVVEVIVEGEPGFDFSRVRVAAAGRTLANRVGNVWTEADFPPGSHTVEAVVDEPDSMTGSAPAEVREGETTQVTITLRRGAAIAKAFVIHFWFDKAFIEPCLREVLQRVVAYSDAHPDEKVLIVGHTDLVGSDDYNQSLSERRGRSVHAYLTSGRDFAASASEWNELRRQNPGGVTIHDTWGTREIQYMLQDLGFYKGNVDEDHGPATDAAIRAFQTDNGLTPDGVMGDATWEKLVEAYLDEDPLSIPEARFFPNAKGACNVGIVKWLGCGEQDPVLNTQDAWRPNRRAEILFIKADSIPCEVPKPVTFDLPSPGFVGTGWCLGPGNPAKRCCFTTRKEPQPGRWLIRPAEPGKVLAQGTITFEDGTPVSNAKYALIAPDGEYLHTTNGAADKGERPAGPQRGRPIPNRADEQGRFSHPVETPEGVYILEIFELATPQVARSTEEPAGSGRGNIVCFRLDAAAAPRGEAFAAPAVSAPAAKKGGVVQSQTTPASADITPENPVVVVKRSYTSPARVPITLTAGGGGGGTLTRSGDTGSVRLFTTAAGNKEFTFTQDTAKIKASQLRRRGGFTLFAESDAPTGSVGNYHLTLNAGATAKADVTAVRVTLDVFTTREPSGAAPQELPQPPDKAPAAGTATDKWFRGGLVNVQDAAQTQERVKLRVGLVEPGDFEGVLELRQVRVSGNTVRGPASRARVFDNSSPTPGESPASLEIPVKANAFPGEDFFLEGAGASAADRDTGFQLGVRGASEDGDRVALTVGMGVSITQSSAQRAVVVRKPHTSPTRPAITLRSTAPLPAKRRGILTVKAASGMIRLFTETGDEITDTANNVFSGTQLTKGVQVFAEGLDACAKPDDIQLLLTLAPGSPAAGIQGSTRLTAVALTLDIGLTRTAAGVHGVLMSDTDKVNPGRFVHQQDPGFHHGRARLLVRPIQPASFAGTQVLSSTDPVAARVALFSDERAAAGQRVVATPLEILSALIPAGGEDLWVQGRRVSGALRDAGFRLELDGQEGDRVALTVVRFSSLVADIPSTPARTARPGQPPVPRHTLRRGAGPNLVATDFDEVFDFTRAARRPLVLVEGSVTAAAPINLRVQVAPADVPVSWSIQRDTRPNGDAQAVVNLSPNAVPTITNATDPLRANLQSDAVGSFYIRPFVDVNGSNRFDFRIDREPFINMKMVLIRVGGSIGTTNSVNTSVAQAHNIHPNPAAPTAATQFKIEAGSFTSPAVAGVHNNAVIVVVGGGQNGRRGLNQMFAGWINNVTAHDIFAEYLDQPTGNRHRHTTVFASNKPLSMTAGLFIPTGVAPPIVPGFTVIAAAPAALALPILDTSPFGNEGTGGNTATGTEASTVPPGTTNMVPGPPPPPANGNHRGIQRTDLPVGQTWQIQMWDSPAHPCLPAHFIFPGDLVTFRFNLDFRTDLCFWTNITGVPGPTGDPASFLYSSVQTDTWQIRFEMTFPPAPAAGVELVPATLTLVKDRNPLRLATPVRRTALEVRFPIGLLTVGFDART
jgi:outer membrane protein OmpA-like peptidoglycan-associated protein